MLFSDFINGNERSDDSMNLIFCKKRVKWFSLSFRLIFSSTLMCVEEIIASRLTFDLQKY